MSTHRFNPFVNPVVNPVVALVLLTAGWSAAQSPDAKRLKIKSTEAWVVMSESKKVIRSQVILRRDSTSKRVVLDWYYSGRMAKPHHLPLPVDLAGSVQYVGKNECIVAACEVDGPTRTGVLYRIAMDCSSTSSKAPSVIESVRIPGRDPYSATYNPKEKRLYFLDAVDKGLWSAPFEGGGNKLPQKFDLVMSPLGVSASALPVLSKGLGNRLLGAKEQNGVILRQSTGGMLIVQKDPVGWRWSAWPPLSRAAGWTLLSSHALSANRVFKLNGPEGRFDIVDVMSNRIAQSGQIRSRGTPVPIECSEWFLNYPGLLLQIKPNVGPAQRWIRLPVRYGQPSAVVAGKAASLSVNMGSHYVGSASVSIRSRLQLAQPAPKNTRIRGSVMIGIRDAKGVDSVITIGKQAVLKPIAIASVDVRFKAGRSVAQATFKHKIPNDARLEGAVILYQMVMRTPSGDLLLTDVEGCMVLPASEHGKAVRRFSHNVQLTRSALYSRTKAELVRAQSAAKAWLGGNETDALIHYDALLKQLRGK